MNDFPSRFSALQEAQRRYSILATAVQALLDDASWTNKAVDGTGEPLMDVHMSLVKDLRTVLTEQKRSS